MPVVEHMAHGLQPPLAEGGTLTAAIDQGLEVAFEVRPADLPAFIKDIITAVAIGTHHPAIVLFQHALNRGRGAGQTDSEHGEQLGRSHSQPGFVRPLFLRCLVAFRGEGARQSGF